jgi:uncharacterized membrane protein YkvA (DUF1232 family)
MDKLKAWANSIKRDVYALYLAARDSRVPWFAKALALATAAYALSPIDLIPDFIPVLGYLDDIVIVPLAIVLTVRLIPVEVMVDLRLQAEQRLALAPPSSRTAAVIIVLIWIVAAIVAVRFLSR